MSYAIVRQKVRDYGQWKQRFDQDCKAGGVLDQAGFKKFGLYRTAEDPNELVIFCEFEDEKKIQDFFQTRMRNEQLLKELGVVGQLQVTFLNRLDKKALGGEMRAA